MKRSRVTRLFQGSNWRMKKVDKLVIVQFTK